jgi:acetylornithine/succinyldiaminopimelate/putrescine aminotransferase
MLGVRGWGLLSGLQLAESSSIVAADVTAALMQAGVLVVPAGPKVRHTSIASIIIIIIMRLSSIYMFVRWFALSRP